MVSLPCRPLYEIMAAAARQGACNGNVAEGSRSMRAAYIGSWFALTMFIVQVHPSRSQTGPGTATRMGDWFSGVEIQLGRPICNAATQGTDGAVLYFLRTKTAWVETLGMNFIHPRIQYRQNTSISLYIDDRIFTFSGNPNSSNALVVSRDDISKRNMFLAVDALRSSTRLQATLIVGDGSRFNISLSGARDALTELEACTQRERRLGVFGR